MLKLAPLTELPNKLPPIEASNHRIVPPIVTAFNRVGIPQVTVLGVAVVVEGADNPVKVTVTEVLVALKQ